MTTTFETSPVRRFIPRLRTVRWDVWIWIAFGIAVVLSRLYLMMVRQVYFFDESVYIKQTEVLYERGLMSGWSTNPGIVILNIPWYFLFRNIPLGLDYASRLAFFVNCTAAFVLMALIVKGYTQKSYWVLGMLLLSLASHPFWNTRPNSSDSYYTVIILLFVILMDYALRRPPIHWSWFAVACLLAFSTTVRNDGTITFALTTLIYGWHLWRSPLTWRTRFVAAFIWVVPIMVLVSGYQWAILRQGGYYEPAGDFIQVHGMSVTERTYVAFEQGEGRTQRYLLESQGKVWWSDGRLLAREIYGTPEENEYSVFRAIANNPGAWLNRLKWNFRDFFSSWQEAFWHHGPPLFVAALWGFGMLCHYRPKSAVIYLLILAPTSFFFLITYWQARYIVTLAPLFIILAIYGLSLISKPPTPSERKWGIGLAVLSAGAILIFYYIGAQRDLPFPAYTVVWTLLLYGLYMWRFIWQKAVNPRILLSATAAAFIFLLVGTFRVPPYSEWVSGTYSYESTSYIIHGFYQHRNERICIGHSDLDAMSLAFYARQVPVPSSPSIYNELVNGTLAGTLEKNNCESALIALTGWSDRSLINAPTTFSNTNANILYRSDKGIIVLLEPLP